MKEQIRKQYPVLRNSIYANIASTGPLYDDLLEWRQEHDLDYLIGGSSMKMHSNKMHSETRKIIGDFFNCPTDNVALVPNFTIGLNFLVEGLNKKEKILLVDGDYPSLNWPFKSRGFTIEYITVSENLEEHIYNVILKKGITVLALSPVQWLNGIKIDFSFLKKLKDDFKELLIICDGTQFLGTQNFNFTDSGIDIIGSSGYKWLLSGYGNGLIMVKEAAKKRFSLLSIGYGSGRNAVEFANERTFCKHLEPGHLDTLCFGSLRFSLEYFKRIGLDKIEEQNIKLSNHARESFNDIGLLDSMVANRVLHSTIFNIKANQETFDKLIQNNVICAQRGDGIRISFHFYNTLEEINTIAKILKN